ncbi:MAG: polymer-forming cytoskeletal protein, partial [Acidobacteriota bacterium]
MLTSRPARIWFLALAISLAVLPAADHFAESFLVPEPTSPLYYQFVLVAGDELEIDRDGSIVGNLHANDEIEIDRDTVVDGNVSATDEIENDGTITGEVLEGAAALTLPGVDPDFFLDRADRVFDDDVVFEDAVIDDVVYVDG